MKDIWSETTAESALLYLRDTDEEFAVAKARVFGLDKTEKVILAEEFLNGAGTVDQRKSQALTSEKYADWQKSHEDAVLDFNILYAKRTTKAAYLECWRSVFSARRRGNV
jgi:hypothetical protein